MTSRSPIDRRRRQQSRLLVLGIAGAILLGGIGYIAFTANDGLPLSSSYTLTVEVPNADRLIKHDNVLMGGIRVGQVAEIDAEPGDPPHARVLLQLDPDTPRLPVDTAVKVRPGAVLGSSYVDIVPGRAGETVPPLGTLPLERAARAVQLTDLLDVFRGNARRHVQQTFAEVGGGLAGRGSDVNEILAELPRLLPPLGRVSAAANAPEARLPDFLRAYDAATAALAPASSDLAGVMAGGAETFGAFARERAALAAGIRELPPTEAAVTSALRNIRPGLERFAEAAVALRPAGPLLKPALRRASRTLAAGVDAVALVPAASDALGQAVDALGTLARDPATSGSLRKLDELFGEADLFLGDFMPAQLTCNIMPLWSRIGQVFGAFGQGNGPALTQIWFTTAGASGEPLQNAVPSSNLGNNFTPHQNFSECEAGNEPYYGTQVLDNPAGLQRAATLDTQAPPAAMALARKAGLLERMERP